VVVANFPFPFRFSAHSRRLSPFISSLGSWAARDPEAPHFPPRSLDSSSRLLEVAGKPGPGSSRRAPARHYSLTVAPQPQAEASVLLSLSPLMNRPATTERADEDFLFRFPFLFLFLFLCLGVTINLTFTLAFHLFPFLCSSSLVASCSAVCQFRVPVHMDGWRWIGKAAAAAAVALLLLSTAPVGGARRGTSIRSHSCQIPCGSPAESMRPGRALISYFAPRLGVSIPGFPICLSAFPCRIFATVC